MHYAAAGHGAAAGRSQTAMLACDKSAAHHAKSIADWLSLPALQGNPVAETSVPALLCILRGKQSNGPEFTMSPRATILSTNVAYTLHTE
jgi:hypothetical protein